ncbi:hypothetical protein C7E12_23225, partial [Stenotrophomonas maltophilia]
GAIALLGENLWEVLHDDEPELEIHDPYQVSEVTLHSHGAIALLGENLWEVLHDDEPELEIHDPYQVSEV